MFFQLSLSSSQPATEAAGDSELAEMGGAGTLTVQAQERPAGDQVARLLAARARDGRAPLQCRVTSIREAAVTYTARPLPGTSEAPDLQ